MSLKQQNRGAGSARGKPQGPSLQLIHPPPGSFSRLRDSSPSLRLAPVDLRGVETLRGVAAVFSSSGFESWGKAWDGGSLLRAQHRQQQHQLPLHAGVIDPSAPHPSTAGTLSREERGSSTSGLPGSRGEGVMLRPAACSITAISALVFWALMIPRVFHPRAHPCPGYLGHELLTGWSQGLLGMRGVSTKCSLPFKEKRGRGPLSWLERFGGALQRGAGQG